MQCDGFMYHLRSNYKNRMEFPFNARLKTLFNIMKDRFKIVLNFDVCIVHVMHNDVQMNQ